MQLEDMKIEIGQYKEVNKGILKAYFSVVIHPQGQKIIDCRYFKRDDDAWISFPQKEVKFQDGRKTEYIPYISFVNKDYEKTLKQAIVQALKGKENDENYDQCSSENRISSKSSALWAG